MVVRAGLMAELPNQSHFFNDNVADKRLNPAGPDHARWRLPRGARLRRGVAPSPRWRDTDGLRTASAAVSALWREHEDSLTPMLLDVLVNVTMFA